MSYSESMKLSEQELNSTQNQKTFGTAISILSAGALTVDGIYLADTIEECRTAFSEDNQVPMSRSELAAIPIRLTSIAIGTAILGMAFTMGLKLAIKKSKEHRYYKKLNNELLNIADQTIDTRKLHPSLRAEAPNASKFSEYYKKLKNEQRKDYLLSLADASPVLRDINTMPYEEAEKRKIK